MEKKLGLLPGVVSKINLERSKGRTQKVELSLEALARLSSHRGTQDIRAKKLQQKSA
jgi:hypothetical protein